MIKNLANYIQILKVYLTNVLDINFSVLTTKSLNDKINGTNNGFDTIYINEKWLKKLKNSEELIVLLSHEAFHLWQNKAVKEQLVDDKIKIVWKEELENYINPKANLTKYLFQSVEKTAIAFSNLVLKTLCGKEILAKSIIDDESLELVSNFNY